MWWQQREEKISPRILPGFPRRDQTEVSGGAPLLIYDRDCGFCSWWVEYWRAITGDRVRYAPSQEAGAEFPQISLEAFRASIQLVEPDGRIFQGAEAVFRAFAEIPEKRWLLRAYNHIPGFRFVSESFYRFVARHRGGFLLRLTSLLWGSIPRLSQYFFSRWLFLRLLGVVYLFAFASLWSQAGGLIGSQGILPAASLLEAVAARFGASGYWFVPTLLWFSSSDAMLHLMAGGGVVLSFLVIAGIATGPLLFLLWLFYLSLVAVGQDFLSFQWDILLLEIGFLASWLAPWGMLASHWSIFGARIREQHSSMLLMGLLRWALFRLIFLSGVVKLMSGDVAWRSLTALSYHYETQPIPNAIAWYMHQLPLWFQKVSVVGMFGIELVVPFFYFAPRNLRFLAAVLTIFLQSFFFFTGNYTFFNVLVIAMCVLLIDDAALARIFSWRLVKKVTGSVELVGRTLLSRRTIAGFVGVILLISMMQLWRIFISGLPPVLEGLVRLVAPLRIVNTYGLFAVMTTSRSEIVIEGSRDGATWVPYEFRYKPGELSERPRWAAPHQPRLDWQMWFAALRVQRDPENGTVAPEGQSYDPWFLNFAVRLLEGSPDVLALLGKNPFVIAPPRLIRASVYEYHFTTVAERHTAGNWWKRELEGVYLPPVSLEKR